MKAQTLGKVVMDEDGDVVLEVSERTVGALLRLEGYEPGRGPDGGVGELNGLAVRLKPAR